MKDFLNKNMKAIYIVLAIVVVCDILFFTYINKELTAEIVYIPGQTVKMTLTSAIIVFMAFYGTILGIIFMKIRESAWVEAIKKESRNLEKAEIETKESTERIKLLENKINTLEIALKEALKEKS